MFLHLSIDSYVRILIACITWVGKCLNIDGEFIVYHRPVEDAGILDFIRIYNNPGRPRNGVKRDTINPINSNLRRI